LGKGYGPESIGFNTNIEFLLRAENFSKKSLTLKVGLIILASQAKVRTVDVLLSPDIHFECLLLVQV